MHRDSLTTHAQSNSPPARRTHRRLPLLIIACCIVMVTLAGPLSVHSTQINQKNPAATGNRQQMCPPACSHFVCLSRWALDNELPTDTHGADMLSLSPFVDPNVTATLPDTSLRNTKDISTQKINIRPLLIVSEPWSPLFTHPLTARAHHRFAGTELSSPRLTTDFSSQGRQPAIAWSQDVVDSIVYTAEENRASFAYQYPVDKTASLNAGVAWIHNLSHITNMPDVFDEDDGNALGTAPGVNLSLGARYKAVSLTGGFIRALDTDHLKEFARIGREDEPVAWNSELAYQTEFLQQETTLAVGYLRSSDSLFSVLPEKRYSTRASMMLFDAAVLHLEYYQDSTLIMGNEEENSHGFTTSIGFGF